MITETLFNAENITANSPQLEKLKVLFPNCFDTSGRFLLEKFQIEITDQAEISREFYSMNWLGKSYAKLLRNLPPETLLAEDIEHNAKPENAESKNLLIQGDNLEVLKHLKTAYTGEIKMIYIDPPYNTGSDGFVYHDDRQFTPEQLAELANIGLDEAERILSFTAKKSNSHSAWLTFMYPRLYIARELLREDGVIFISIDDNEAAQLKLLCDESALFGEINFIAQLPTIMNLKGNNDEFGFAGTHEYTLVYAKNKSILEDLSGIHLSDEDIKEYSLDDGLGLYKEGATLMRTGEAGAREARPRGYYPIYVSQDLSRMSLKRIADSDYEIFPKTKDGKEMSWRRAPETLEKSLSEFVIKQTRNGISFYKKQRLSDDLIYGKKSKTLFYKPEYSSGNGTAILKSEDFFGKRVFNNPKPIELIKDFILVGTERNKEAIVLDFFAGSASTAHAVMELNAQNKNNFIKYICIQLPEDLDLALKTASKEAKKTIQNAIDWLDENDKPHNIFEITKARIEKAAAKIQTENPNASGASNKANRGFKIYKTVKNFRAVSDNDFSPGSSELPLFTDLNDEQRHALLTTWALADGAKLTTPITETVLGNYTAYLCEKRLYLLNEGFTSADLLAFIQKLDHDAAFNPNRVILLGSAIESRLQKELDQALATYGNRKNISISLIVRN